VEKAIGNLKERLSARREGVSSESHLSGKLFVQFIALMYLEFHSIIIEAAASPRITELREQYYSLSQQYRALALELPGRFFEICTEHRHILGALEESDKEKAETYAREHYFNTAEKIAKAFESKAEA
jgi:DNA-binding GntR family transcriptional regulator